MALLLGAFVLVGLKPGPLFLEEHLDIAFRLAGTVIFANIIGAAALLLLAPRLAELAFIRGSILGPLVLVLVVIGGFLGSNSMWDVLMVFVFGTLGYVMKVYKYNRPAMFLGFVLGAMGERYFGLALRTHGPLFFLRPISLTLFVGTILVLLSDPLRAWFARRKRES